MRVGYIQIFSENQKQFSPEEWATILNVEKLFIDVYVPGPLTDRPKFRFLLDRFLRPGDVLVLDSIASLNPNSKEWFDVKARLTDQEVSIEVYKEKLSNKNALYSMIFDIYISMWEYFHITWDEYKKPTCAETDLSLQGVYYRKEDE